MDYGLWSVDYKLLTNVFMKITYYLFVWGSLLIALAAYRFSSFPSEEKQPAAKLSEIKKDFVFGDQRPFAQCHASTLVRTKDNQFLVAWFGGTREKHDDVGIWLSKGVPGKWSAPREVAKIREDAHWNPVLFNLPSGEVMLYFKVGKTIDFWETWYMISGDNGRTWSEPKELVPGDKGGRGPVRNKPIILSNGTWLAPASDEKNKVWNAFVDMSEDGGKTWKANNFIELDRKLIPNEGVIQPALWESSPGNVHMLLRSSAGVICRSDSRDYGKTWSPVYKTSLPNPNTGIDLTKLPDGTLVLVYNKDNKNWGERQPLSVTVSKDNGNTWTPATDLETGQKGDEFSYPSIISYGDSVAGTYTWKRQRIAFWTARVK
jgi:predicted neuraminidase